MDATVTVLVDRFERGRLTRRELIEALTALIAVAGTSTAASAQTPGMQATAVTHTSVLVSDLQRSAEFYLRVFGLKPVSEDKANKILRLGAGGSGVGSTIVSLREQNPPGIIDHFALKVQGFNRDTAVAALKQHGLTPDQNIEFGFYVRDPDGAVVQMM